MKHIRELLPHEFTIIADAANETVEGRIIAAAQALVDQHPDAESAVRTLLAELEAYVSANDAVRTLAADLLARAMTATSERDAALRELAVLRARLESESAA